MFSTPVLLGLSAETIKRKSSNQFNECHLTISANAGRFNVKAWMASCLQREIPPGWKEVARKQKS